MTKGLTPRPRVIGVVGPSGVGKDSVMAGIAAAAPQFRLARRAITRPPALGGEDYEALTDDAFAARLAQGDFCLHWTAHGLSYGIPVQVQQQAEQGQGFLVNLSRSVLADAAKVLPDFLILNVTARAEILAARLAGRGRETEDDIRARLARDGARLPAGVPVLHLPNEGPLDQTIAAALTALEPLGV